MNMYWKNYFLYTELANNLDYYVKTMKLKTRPNATSGLWMFFILPLSIILSTVKLNSVSLQYRNITFLCINLIIVTYIFLLPKKSTNNKIYNYKTILIIVNILIYSSIIYNAGILFNLAITISSTSFFIIFPLLLQYCPFCFTAGEAALISQSIIIFIFASGYNLIQIDTLKYLSDMQISTAVLQIGLLGILNLCIVISSSGTIFHDIYKFYIITFINILFIILMPMYLLLKINPLLWMIEFLFKTKRRIGMLAYWILCIIIVVITIIKEVERNEKANTTKRKVFHILGVAIFFPALLYECTLLYLASGVVLGIFIFLEIIRILKIPPLGPALESGYLIFVDDKDLAGGIALSPIYLLVGISLPLWLHPYGCDLTDSVGFQLLPFISGLLTIGIGDTAASVIGVRFGKNHWQGSKKTKEGTLGSILCQLFFVSMLFYLGLIIDKDIPKAVIAVIITSLVEAKTDQVDNLVLPIIAYMILI